MSAMTTERVLFEAELIIAPPKCRATMLHVAACTVAFRRSQCRDMMTETVGALILRDLLAYEADAADVQWFIDLELMPAEFLAEWEAARA